MTENMVETGQKSTNFSKSRFPAKGLCNPLITEEKNRLRTRKDFLDQRGLRHMQIPHQILDISRKDFLDQRGLRPTSVA